MKKINKKQIKQYLLQHISDKNLIKKAVENFEISKSTVYNYLKELLEDKAIIKGENSFKLNVVRHYFRYDTETKLAEDKIFDEDIAPLLSDINKNVFSIWRYSFTEMMNNAIEHSLAKTIEVLVETNSINTLILICDDGIGIFKNIQNYMLEEKNETLSYDECATLLLSGKFTTAKHLHSGEGIFFTSHLMDRFMIYSDEVTFSRDSFKDLNFRTDTLSIKTGTFVSMLLHNSSKKTTKEIFDQFSNLDGDFIKTQIPIAHVFSNGNPVSRSEARRLGELVLKFEEIELDFENVEEVGQAFCHELFVVWQSRNPEKNLKITNANSDVQRMINRVKNQLKTD